MQRKAILQLAIISVMLLLTGCGNENLNNQNENKDSIVAETEKETNDQEISTEVYDEVLQRFYENAVNADVEALFESGEFINLADSLINGGYLK
jgi:protein involved in sex pheromone biosynthesis